MRNGAIFGREENFSFHEYRKPSACDLKPLREIANTVQIIKKPVSISPGTMPAINRRPIEVSVAIPYRMNVTEGGIRMPSVPPAQIEPVATSSG